MSFMYNPFPYDDPRPVNRPALPKEAIDGLVTGGSTKVAATLAGRIAGMMDGKGSVVVAFDGYTTADFTRIVNLLSQQLQLRNVAVRTLDFSATYKSEAEFKDMIDDKLWWTAPSTRPFSSAASTRADTRECWTRPVWTPSMQASGKPGP